MPKRQYTRRHRSRNPAKRQAIPELIALSMHAIEECKDCIHCVQCLGTCSTHDHAKLVRFLRADCTTACISQGTRICSPISINGVSTHQTHAIHFSTLGFYFCSRCGMSAKHKIHKLRLPCMRPDAGPTVHGRNIIKRAADASIAPKKVQRRPTSLASSSPQGANNEIVLYDDYDTRSHDNHETHNDVESDMESCGSSNSSGELWRPPGSPCSFG